MRRRVDPGNSTVDFHREKPGNKTHKSTTDPKARLARKGTGKEAKLAFLAHVLMEKPDGFCADISVAPPSGTAERKGALRMIRSQKPNGLRPRTVGADKGYDAASFVDGASQRGHHSHAAAKAKDRAALAHDKVAELRGQPQMPQEGALGDTWSRLPTTCSGWRSCLSWR